MARITINIDEKIKNKFKAACAENGETITVVLLRMIAEYIRRRGK